MKIIDQPTGLRAGFDRGSPSAASSAGAGSLIGGSDKAIVSKGMKGIHPA
jgi:hypothetical protein